MSLPLYFLPGAEPESLTFAGSQRLDPALLERHGLGLTWRDVRIDDLTVNHIRTKGPGGKSGLLLAAKTFDGRGPLRPTFVESEQEWRPLGDPKQAWIGLEKSAEPPGPDELRRKLTSAGYSVELAGGQRWQVPIVRRPDDSTELPREAYFDDHDRFVEEVKAEHRALWEEMGAALNWFDAETFDGGDFSREKGLDLAIRALAINYRFGRGEQRLLRAIDSTNWATVLAMAIDLPTALSVLDAKKNSAPPTEPGGASS